MYIKGLTCSNYYKLMIGISKFARETGNPLCTYMRECVTFKENTELKRVWFLAGDPTAYGNADMKMPEQGISGEI
jgi:hypothetical protein